MGDLNSLSHFLSKLLRHEATKRGLDISAEGYVDIEDILDQPEASAYTLEDVERVVRRDRKGRFAIKSDGIVKCIRATQGHTIKLENPQLEPVTHWTQAQFVIHGTRRKNLTSILANGLSRKNRQHIHFAVGETRDVKSGMPNYCDTVVEVDVEKAMRDGLKFYKSENDVVLCPGDSNGYLQKKYFKRIYDRKTKTPLPMD